MHQVMHMTSPRTTHGFSTSRRRWKRALDLATIGESHLGGARLHQVRPLLLLLLLLFPDDDEEFKWQQTHERVQKPAPHFQDLNSKKPSQHPLFRPVSCKTSREVNQGGQFTTTSLFLFWTFMKSNLQLSMQFFRSFHPLPWDGPPPCNSSKWRFRSGCCTKM